MLWIPQKGVRRVQHNTGTVGASMGTAVTTGATAPVKGTVVELIASTLFDAYSITVMTNGYAAAGTASEGCLDILLGGATETVLIPDLLMGQSAARAPRIWRFPLYIPAGSRLAAKVAGVIVNTAMRVAIYLEGGDGLSHGRVGSKVVTYGMGTVPNGTTIAPGASGAEGTFTQIVAATTENHFAFIPSFQGATDSTMGSRSIQVDIGIGAATEEEIGSWWFQPSAAEEMTGPLPPGVVYRDVLSGTRLAMRASNDGTNDTSYNGVIHALS